MNFAAHVKTSLTADCDVKQVSDVFGSVDRVEGFTTITLELHTFHRFLVHPEERVSVVFAQVGIILDLEPDDYHSTLQLHLLVFEGTNPPTCSTRMFCGIETAESD